VSPLAQHLNPDEIEQLGRRPASAARAMPPERLCDVSSRSRTGAPLLLEISLNSTRFGPSQRFATKVMAQVKKTETSGRYEKQ